MTNARWSKFKFEQEQLTAKDPIRVGGKIVERLIRVVGEERVIERTFYEFDRDCDWRRKLKEVMTG